jgi:hypothetical protein
LHVAITKYLEQIAALKKPNTHRKYEAVLNRFGEFFRDRSSIDAISGDDLTRFVVTLKKDHRLGSNTILHNAVIVAQFLKRQARRELEEHRVDEARGKAHDRSTFFSSFLIARAALPRGHHHRDSPRARR